MRVFGLYGAVLAACAALAQDRTVPAVNEVALWEQVGQQPYEFTWVQRSQDPQTVVDFEDLSGWTLELFDGATGQLRRSREEQLWGQYVAKVQYSAARDGGRVVARPSQSVRVPAPFDSVDMWVYGNFWDWDKDRDKSTPPVSVAVLLKDARGKEFRVPLADTNWKQWWLVHRRVAESMRKEMTEPVAVAGIEVSNIRNQEPRCLFFDSLAVYKEELKPLKFAAQPRRNLKPYRGMIAGLNTGAGVLPFPTREDTILPANAEAKFTNAVTANGSVYSLSYKGADAEVVYRYAPRSGTLDEITVTVDGGAPVRPFEGGGLRFGDGPDAPIATGELVSSAATADHVAARFRSGAHVFDYELRVRQKSLVLDVWCDDGEARELAFGRVSGVSAPKLITVPYLTYGGTNPRVLMSGTAERPLFTSIWFDWYRTNGSEAYSASDPQVTASTAEINGGVRYHARTDGKRNNLYERAFLTVSPVYEETLPTIPNPPSLRQKEGSEVVWTVAEDLETFERDHKRSEEIRSYGLDKIMQHSHEITWRDEGDSFTLRLKAAPQKGGDAALAWYVRAQNDLGWLQGVYTNYTDFIPTNTNWSPDHVQRTSDGEWRRAWMRSYAEKPAKAVEFDDYYARRIQEKFGTRMSYTDVHTAVSPWGYCDYDARVPGAGTMAATFYAYGQLLLNDQRVYGPTQSEGTYQWMYAGLESGSYGWVYTNVNLLTAPLDVAFHLEKIHPLQCDYGMGYTGLYLGRIDREWTKSPKISEYLDLFLATTIAYGNMGWLPHEIKLGKPFGVEAKVRSYYMMQQLQQQYAFTPPKTIEYEDADGNFVGASRAHATGAMARSRLHVVYKNGTEVYVNRSSSGPWEVKGPHGTTVELPVSGWLVFNTGANFYESSSNVNGARADYVSSAAYEYLDGRGTWTARGTLGAQGSVVRRSLAGGAVEIMDLHGNDRIRFAAPAGGKLEAFAADGTSCGDVAYVADKGRLEFRPVADGRRYVYRNR